MDCCRKEHPDNQTVEIMKRLRAGSRCGLYAPLVALVPALNLQVAAKIEKGEPVTAPGVPKNYPDAKKLVTEDCIKPTTT